MFTGQPLADHAWPAIRRLLRDAFDDDPDDVFYGQGTKPSVLELVRAARAARGRPRKLAQIIGRPEVTALVRRVRGDLRDVTRALPFLVPALDAGLVAARRKSPTFPVVIGNYRDVAALQVDGLSWKDPVQGCLGDCYLIAAMSALAWSRPATWRERLAQAVRDGAKTNQLRFNLYRNGVSQYAPFDMPGRVPVGFHGQPVYARARRRDESWPSLVERAFVMQRCRLRGVDPDEHHYDRLGDPDDLACYPEHAARMLAGGRARTYMTLDRYDAPLSAILARGCDDGMVRHPTMASTASASPQPTPDERARWRASGLVPGHAYTVLGLMERAGRRFVVLRNPYGFNPPRAAHAAGTWRPGAGAPDPSVALGANGVVAITAARFDAWFVRLGWVELPPDPA